MIKQLVSNNCLALRLCGCMKFDVKKRICHILFLQVQASNLENITNIIVSGPKLASSRQTPILHWRQQSLLLCGGQKRDTSPGLYQKFHGMHKLSSSHQHCQSKFITGNKWDRAKFYLEANWHGLSHILPQYFY